MEPERFICARCGKEQNAACNRVILAGKAVCSDCAKG
jgi:formylmethanofuran dehydrogenase subunit E